MKFIKNYHEIHNIRFIMEKEFDEKVNEYYYHYENIGLSIWFEDGLITNICVAKSLPA